MRDLRFWLLASLVLAAMAAAGCPQPKPAGNAAPASPTKPPAGAQNEAAPATSSQASTAGVTVLPAGQSGNPYAADYKEWDTWALALVQGQTARQGNPPVVFFPDTSNDLLYAPDLPADQLQVVLRIDGDGYLVPLMRVTDEIEQAIRDQRTDLYGAESFWITGKGKADPELKNRFELAQDQVRAAFYPAIPLWIALQPPLFASFLPNGDVVTRGLVGHYAEKELFRDPCCIKKGQIIGRYNAKGEMVRAILDPWWFLYYDKDLKPVPMGDMQVTVDGYVKFYQPGTKQLLAVYDYDATQLPAVEPNPRDPHPFLPLRGDMITRFYHAAAQATAAPAPEKPK